MNKYVVRISSGKGSMVVCGFESPEPMKKVAAWISGLLGKATVEVDAKGQLVQDGDAARPILYAIPREDMGVLLSTMRELTLSIQETNKLARHNMARAYGDEADEDEQRPKNKSHGRRKPEPQYYVG